MYPLTNLIDSIGFTVVVPIGVLLLEMQMLLFWLAEQMETKRFRWLVGSAEVLLAAVAALHLTHHYFLLVSL